MCAVAIAAKLSFPHSQSSPGSVSFSSYCSPLPPSSLLLSPSPSHFGFAYPPSLCCLLKPFCVIIFCGFAFSILPRRLPFVHAHTHTCTHTLTHTYTQGQKLLLMTLTGWAGTPPFGRSVRARALQLSFMQSQPHTHS